MFTQLLRHFEPTRRLILQLGRRRAAYFGQHITKYLTAQDKVLDIGVGIGDVTLTLTNAGFNVTPLDIKDITFTPKVKPIIYDGHTMPFANHEFDTALIVTVLHHTKDPEAALREAKRTAHTLIIMEDVYESRLQKYVTFFVDSLLNLEFFGHPHSNHTDAEWRVIFTRLRLSVTASESMRSFMVMRHKLYVLVPIGTDKNPA